MPLIEKHNVAHSSPERAWAAMQGQSGGRPGLVGRPGGGWRRKPRPGLVGLEAAPRTGPGVISEIIWYLALG